MKLIEVTDEMFNSLMELSEDLNSQDHRCTRMPYMLQVSKEVEIAAYSGCGECIWVNSEGDELRDEQDVKEYLRINDFELSDFTEEHEALHCIDVSWRIVEVTKARALENFFFTDKGLRDFYGKDVNTFLTGVRNPELELVMKFLCELSGGELHK